MKQPRYFVLPPVEGGYAWWDVRDYQSTRSTNVIKTFSKHSPTAERDARALCDKLNEEYYRH